MNSLNTIQISDKLPKYSYPINESMITLEDGRIMSTIMVRGMPFELESQSTLESAFTTVKTFLNQLAREYGSNLGIWTHIVKKKDTLKNQYKFDNPFIQSLSDEYIHSLSGNILYKTEYFITFILKSCLNIEQAEEESYDLLKQAKSVLSKYDAEVLSISDLSKRCRNIEFLSYLLNHNESSVPLNSSKVIDTISQSDWHFGYDMLEIRNAQSSTSKYATFYELDGYPAHTNSGMWDFILNQKCEFVLTQSMILMKMNETLKLIDAQANLVGSSDNAQHELTELHEGRDYVATGEISFGDYHCSLAVFADTKEETIEKGADITSDFVGSSTAFKRSNLKSQFSLLSMMPCSEHRIKPSPKTTTNLACTWSLHNYACGKPTGNPIGNGSALMPLKTTADTLFYLNCHASDKEKNVTGQKYAGHTEIQGASGTGKTTLEAVITAYATRFNPQIFTIDYNRSTELFMRAYGAEYFAIREGEDIGLNPFQFPDSPELRSFLNRLVYRITANNDGVLDEAEEQEVKQSIEAVMEASDSSKKGLSLLLQSIQLPNLRARLSKWCRSTNGQFSWCLDAPQNKFNPENMDRIGFDSTLLLELDSSGQAHPACEAILGTLFFLKSLMQREGRLMLTIVEEYWMPANFPLTQAAMKKILKAGRLRNEFMILSSQSPEDAIDCEIYPAINQQTATKIYLPNPYATFEQYQKCGLTLSEFEQLKKLDKFSRTFLIKQSNVSQFAKLDLSGFDDFLPIISGTEESIAVCDRIRAEHGNDPAIWIPRLQKEFRKSK